MDEIASFRYYKGEFEEAYMFDWVHYQFPSRVFLERDSMSKIGTFISEIGSRTLIISVKKEAHRPEVLQQLNDTISKSNTGCIIYDDITDQPDLEQLDTAAHFAKQSKANVILAYGSRESFFAAKAIALLSTNDIFAADLARRQESLKKPPLPVVIVPTIPSMGEETSPFVTIYDSKNKNFHHIKDWRLFPAMIFFDPSITSTLPNSELSRSGTAVLAAAVESILSRHANEITNSIAIRAIELIAVNLLPLIKDGRNTQARTNICMASILSGMAHSNSYLGLCYSIAIAVNKLTGIDFYMAMSILIPHAMEYNLTTSASRYVQIAKALEENITDITVIEAAIKAVEAIRKISQEAGLQQRLSDFEVNKNELSNISRMAINQMFIENTPRIMDQSEVENVLLAAY